MLAPSSFGMDPADHSVAFCMLKALDSIWSFQAKQRSYSRMKERTGAISAVKVNEYHFVIYKGFRVSFF